MANAEHSPQILPDANRAGRVVWQLTEDDRKFLRSLNIDPD